MASEPYALINDPVHSLKAQKPNLKAHPIKLLLHWPQSSYDEIWDLAHILMHKIQLLKGQRQSQSPEIIKYIPFAYPLLFI